MIERRDLVGIDDRSPTRGWTGRFRSLLYPPLGEIASRNRLAWAVLFALVAVGGSLLSFSVGILAAWALISLVLLRFPGRIERSDRFVIASTLTLFAVLVAGSLFHQSGAAAAWLGVRRLFFIAPLFLVCRMRVTPADKVLNPVFFGAAIGGTLLIPIVLVEYFGFSNGRVSAFAGNPGPLSVVALLTAGLATLHFRASQSFTANILAVLGAGGASLTVFLTGMRGAWPALPVVLGIAIWFRRAEIRQIWCASTQRQRITALASMAIVSLLAVVAVLPVVLDRILLMEADLSLLGLRPGERTSLALRLDIYSAGWAAFMERPWFGWGSDQLWDAISPHLDPRLFADLSFSHLHNFFLTTAVGSGIVGIGAVIAVLVAPAWTAWRWRTTGQGGDRLAFALILVAAFAIPGMTNIMFFHDILDAVWVLSVSTLCASIPVSEPTEETRAVR